MGQERHEAKEIPVQYIFEVICCLFALVIDQARLMPTVRKLLSPRSVPYCGLTTKRHLLIPGGANFNKLFRKQTAP